MKTPEGYSTEQMLELIQMKGEIKSLKQETLELKEEKEIWLSWNEFSAAPCPRCVYKDGLFISHCSTHEMIEDLRWETERLKLLQPVCTHLDTEKDKLRKENERLKKECEIPVKDSFDGVRLRSALKEALEALESQINKDTSKSANIEANRRLIKLREVVDRTTQPLVDGK